MRVGIVGAGSMGTTHTASWKNTPAEIAGVFSLSPQKLAADHNLHIFNSFDELVDAVDVVDICTPTNTHHDLTLKAAAKGKHVICEKPLARTYAEGQAMLEACTQAGVKLLVAHVVRFFPEYTAAKATVAAGDIGDVAIFRSQRSGSQPHAGTDHWMLDPVASGGVILDLMIHELDFARWIVGEVVSVYAKDVRSKTPDSPGDYALAVLRHANGAISNIETAWAYPNSMFRTSFEIAGSDGLIEHHAGTTAPVSVHMKQTESAHVDVVIPSSPLLEDAYTIEMKHFYDVLVNNADPIITAEDGLAALRIGLAAIQSAQTGKPVMIEEVQ